MNKEKLRVIPLKNYFILAGILILSFLLLFYFYAWFDKYEETKLNLPILNKYMTVININELDDYLVENPNSVLYVSMLNNEEIRSFEKLIKKSYKDNLIDTSILYLDISKIKENEKNNLKKRYSLNNLSILDVPCVLSFKEGVLDSIFSVRDNNYDINIFVRYVNQFYQNEGMYD